MPADRILKQMSGTFQKEPTAADLIRTALETIHRRCVQPRGDRRDSRECEDYRPRCVLYLLFNQKGNLPATIGTAAFSLGVDRHLVEIWFDFNARSLNMPEIRGHRTKIIFKMPSVPSHDVSKLRP